MLYGSLGGRAWFRDEQGIHVFDGKEWTYATLCPPINSEQSLPRFSVSPSGKFAVAMAPRVPGRAASLVNPDVWFWTADSPAWQKLPMFWMTKRASSHRFVLPTKENCGVRPETFCKSSMLRVVAT